MNKYFFILCLSVILISCKNEKENEAIQEDLETVTATPKNTYTFEWLLGNWKRVSEDTTSTTYENWERVGSQYKGHGFVVQDNDTVWEEYMLFRQLDTTWVLSVQTPGNADLVNFELTSYSPTNFSVENEANEFPKKIYYETVDQQLKAEISGGGDAVSFEFVKRH